MLLSIPLPCDFSKKVLDPQMIQQISASRASFSRLPGNVKGVLWVLLACVFFSVMGALVKSLESEINSFQVVFFRCGIGLLAILPLILRTGVKQVFQTNRLYLHLFRASIGMMAMFCMFYAYGHLKLVDVTTITYSKVLFITALAPMVLGEKLGWRRPLASAIGFMGVIVMLRPTAAGIEWASLVALLGAMGIAIALLAVKLLAKSESPFTTLSYFAVVSTAVSLIPALMVWQSLEASQLITLVLIGVLGVTGQFCNIRGIHAGEASVVTPASYTSLIFAFALGYLFFDEIPDAISWAGAVIIIGTTLYISYREFKLGRKVSTGTPPQLP